MTYLFDASPRFLRHHRADAKRRDPVIQLYDRSSCREEAGLPGQARQ
ncbi:MAG: hypothetical protein AB1586_08175 [Pseudomonadota bacterium]